MFTSATSAGTITAGTQTSIKLAVGAGGTIAAGVVNLATNNLTGLFYSNTAGVSWSQLTTPAVTGGQAPINIALAIDPSSTNIVYVSGDNNFNSNGHINALAIKRINATTNTTTNITDDTATPVNTSNGSTTHPDSRALVFDANGRLLIGTDGGIYARSNPLNNTGQWTGLNNLSTMELYALAFDGNSKRLVISAQDNGTSYQATPGGQTFNQLGGGDGINARVNDTTLGSRSAIYTTCQFYGCALRTIVDNQGNIVGQANLNINTNGSTLFASPFVLNNIDPTKIAVSDNNVYVTQDTLSGANGVTATNITLNLTQIGTTSRFITALDYGTRNNVNAIVAGGGLFNDVSGSLFLSTTAGANSLVNLPAYAGMAPTSVKFDTRSDSRFFVADSLNLYGTVNQGGTFQTLTASLPANFIRPTSVGFIDNNGVAALLVGGLNNADNAGNPLVVADSSATGVLSGWRRFATSLPNTTVDSLQYDVKADTLAIGTVGRGAYLLYDVTSNFASASVLQFGLANNDSIPDPSLLFGNRPLVKYGTGTLSIVGASTYTGSSTILQGTMLATSASVFAPLSAFTVAGGATLDLGSFNQTIGSLAGAGNVSLGAAALTAGGDSTSTVFSGGISGAGGSLIKTGAGTLTLSGNNSYTGSTTVNGGILQVDGSIASSGPTQVNANAALTGVGSVGNTVIGANGALMPGNGTPGSSMTFNGSLAFQSAALYLVQINPTTSSFASVTGTASLNGATVNAFYANGSYVPKQYTILTAGSVIGAFNSLVNVNLPSSFKASLSTDLTHAFLNLALDFTPGPTFGRGLNSNQQGVANALTNFFNATGGIPLVYGTLTPSGLTQVSGETATGSQQTTFNAMTQFLGVLTDPFIDGRGSAPGPKSGPQAFAEDDQANAYAASRKRTNAERDAYAIFTKAPLAKSYDPRWSVWAAGFGGSQNTGGNAVIGSNDATSRIFGTAVGADVLLSPRTISGFSLAGGGTNFSVNGFGSGRSDLFQAGAFIRHNVGPAYITGALAYGWQDVTTDRIVTIAGVDRLRAAFKANAFSGRVEGGYRFVTPWAGGVGITPYAAGQFTTFGLPAYAEQVLSGANTFALAYGSRNVTDTRGELGIRADKSFAMQNAILTLRGRAAWAHDFNPDRNVGATFQALPGASFVVNGAAQASDSALITAAAEMKWLNGWSAAATFEGEFSNVTTSYAGKGVVRYAW